MPADSRQRAQGRPKLTFLLLAVFLICGFAGIFLYVKQDDAGSRRLDADLCPSEGGRIAGSATLLLDFRKPLDEAHLGVPGALLHDLSLELDANTELRVFVLTTDADAPRQALARVCKPYDNADLSIPTAKDQRNIVRDCDDLPAQLPAALREAASSFCTRRDAVRRRIDALARRSGEEPVANAYLIEALDATELEFADRPTPHTLYVFSDMLQHAQWYSHLELGWTDWSFEDFDAMREARYPSFGRWPSVAGQRVKVFYVPRRDLTTEPRVRQAHKQFWREFFLNGQVTFQDQRANSAYAVVPRMFLLTEAEIAAREREAAERLLAQVKEEQALLEVTQQEQQRAQQELEERIREREARLEAERERLQRLAQEQQKQQEEQQGPDPVPRPSQPPPTVANGPDERSDSDIALAATSDTEAADGRGGDSDAAAAPAADALPCDVELAPEFDASASYPAGGQFNFGDASVHVRYTVDALGATVDNEVFVDPDESSASRPRQFERFANTVRQTVRRWEFVFEDADANMCTRRQQLATTFEFRYD